MAITKMWPVKKGRLDRPIDYITQDSKTARQSTKATMAQSDDYTSQELMLLKDVMDFWGQEEEKQELEKVLGYAISASKTEDEKFVTCINCDAPTARQEMELAKRQWRKESGNVCMHGIQAFRPGEVTPELAHQIGIELANALWGDRFQVVVATHLDKKHIHNHFVINYVSFADGKRFHYGQDSYDILRITSDHLCQEYGLSVIDRPRSGRQVNPKAYEKAGIRRRPSHYNQIKRDIDEAIYHSHSMDDFYRFLRQKGYTFRSGNLKYFTLRHPDSNKNTRIDDWYGEDYSLAGIERRIKEQPLFRPTHMPGSASKRKVQYRGNFRKDTQRKSRSRFQRMYLYYCYVFGVFPTQRQKRSYISRSEVRKMQNIAKETRLLYKHGIETMDQLEAYRAARQARVSQLSSQRKPLYNQLRYAADPERQIIQQQIDVLTAQIKAEREQIRLCNDICNRAARQQAIAAEETNNTTAQKEEKQNGFDARCSQPRGKSDLDVGD